MSKPLHLKTTLQIFGFNEDLDSVSLIVMQETANLEKGEDNPLIRFSIDLPVDVMKHFFFDSLKKLNLGSLSNGFRFDTQIILELLGTNQRITEIPIPTFYGDEVSHVNGLEYAREIIWDTLRHRVKHGVSKESSIDK